MKKYITVLFLSLIFGGCKSTEPVRHLVEQCSVSATEYSASRSGNALLVIVDDEIVIEDYHPDYGPLRPHTLTEISTLLIALTILAAEDEDVLSMDDYAANFIREWNQDHGKSNVTIGDLLQGISGLESGSSQRSSSYTNALVAPVHSEPGLRFSFDPVPYQVLGFLIGEHLGGAYLMDNVLSDLDIPGERWILVNSVETDAETRQASFHARYFDGANMTARELGKIGMLIINNGEWNGQSVIRDLFNRLTNSSSIAPGFSRSVWLNTDTDPITYSDFFNHIPADVIHTFGEEKLIYNDGPEDLIMAAGRYNQRLYMIPSRNMVIVRFGRENFTWNDNDFLSELLCVHK